MRTVPRARGLIVPATFRWPALSMLDPVVMRRDFLEAAMRRTVSPRTRLLPAQDSVRVPVRLLRWAAARVFTKRRCHS
jgi:hypothetical protein